MTTQPMYIVEDAWKNANGMYTSRVIAACSFRLAHETAEYATEEDAMEAARAWVSGMREMAEASMGPTRLG